MIKTICTYRTTEVDRLKQHLIDKHLQFRCHLCNLTTKDRILLKDPITTVHQEQQTSISNTKGTHLSQGNNYQCEKCGISLISVEELIKHIVESHKTDYDLDCLKPKYSCESCTYESQRLSELKTHVDKHHRKRNCDYCNELFLNESTLKDHVYEKHPEIIMFHTIAGQVNDMADKCETFDNFKSHCLTSLNTIIENQNILKQEIFIIRNQLHKDRDTAKDLPEIPESQLIKEPKQSINSHLLNADHQPPLLL